MSVLKTAPAAVPSLLCLPRPWLIGVLHLPALPGSPASALPVADIAQRTAADAGVLADAGFTAVIIENFHDSPFCREAVEPETIASLAVIAAAVRESVSCPLGINVLRNDARAALAVAATCGGSFVRVNVLAGAAVTDQGLIQGSADTLLRARSALRAEHVAILADVDVKHATSLDTRPVTERAADLVARSGADAVLVTGAATGVGVDLDELARVRDAVTPAPVLAASGTTADSLARILTRCDGTLVGTALEDPATGRPCRDRAAAYVESRAP